MMTMFDAVDNRMDRFKAYLDKLYYAGKLKLSDLQSFRKILKDIESMLSRLRSLSLFGFIPFYVKKDVNRLNSELLLMEYNVSLISTGFAN